MGTWIAFYVRIEGNTTPGIVQERFPDAKMDLGGSFIGMQLPLSGDLSPPREKLRGVSAELRTDGIWLSFQSTVDAFEYHHWRAGAALRSLVYGCYEEERTWEEISGTPEPWEQTVLFGQNELERSLNCIQEESYQEELRRIWRERELLPGRTDPGIDARETARGVAEFYRFPGWS